MNRYPSTFMRRLRPGARSPAPACRADLGRSLLRRNGFACGPPGFDLRVVQVEGGPLGPDARNEREVVPRRRAGRRPLQRVRVAPWVVRGDPLAVPRGL